MRSLADAIASSGPGNPAQRVRETAVDLRRQLAVARTWLPLLVASVVLAGAAAFLVTSQMQKVYEAQATLIVGQSLSNANPDYTQLLASQRLSSTYARIATTRPLLGNVATKLGLAETPDQIAGRVRAEAALDSALLTVTAQDSDPARAAALANAVAAELIAASPAVQGRASDFQASVDEQIKSTQAQIAAIQADAQALSDLPTRTPAQDATLDTLQGRLISLRTSYSALLAFSSSSESNLLTIVEPAVAPGSPVSPRPLLNTLLGAVLGLLFAVTLIVLVTHLDDTVRRPDDVEAITSLPTLGAVMKIPSRQRKSEFYRLVALLYPRSSAAEAYRKLRTNVEFATVDIPLATLLVTSSVPGEGKTITATNLAVVFAQAGHRVLLVDADLRKPGVDKVFRLANTKGLTDLLRGGGPKVDAVAQSTEQDNLRVVTTGPLPPNPAELLASQRMRTVAEELRAGVDLVIFDSPPLQAVTDAAVLSSFLDGTLLVVGAGISRRGAVRLGRAALAQAGANVLGVVVNRLRDRDVAADYGSYYGTESESIPADGAEKRAPATAGSS